MLELNCKY